MYRTLVWCKMRVKSVLIIVLVESFLSMLSYFSRVWLFATPWTVALQAPSVHEVSQARILERVAISTFRGSSPSKDWICVSCVFCIAGGFFTHWATWGTQGLSLVSPNEQKSLTQCPLSWSAICREDVGTLKRIPKSGLGYKVYHLITSLS